MDKLISISYTSDETKQAAINFAHKNGYTCVYYEISNTTLNLTAKALIQTVR